MKNVNQKFLILAVFALVLGLRLPAHAGGFSLQKKHYFFTTYFEVMEAENPYATVVRDTWRPLHRRYDGYDAAGEATFTARTRLMGLGNVFAWAQRMAVHDENAALLGTIDGEFWTLAAARFRIYGADGQARAVVYVDRSNVGALVTPHDAAHPWLARYTRRREADFAPDLWEIETFDSQIVHPHVWTALGCLLSDSQESLFPATAYD